MNHLLKLICMLLLVGWCNAFAFAADEALPGRQAEQAGNLREALTHYVEALKTAPLDQQMREKIIKLAVQIQPPPAISEDAKRHMARGQAAIKAAKAPEDWTDAVREYETAVYFAPWHADAYYNLGVARDKAGQYDGAIWALKMYLLAKPQAADTEQVKSLIFEIEYRQEKAQKESEKKAAEQKAKVSIESLSGEYSAKMWGGAKFEWVSGTGSTYYSSKPERNGLWNTVASDNISVEINGSSITITMRAINPQNVRAGATYRGTISGTRIEGTMTEEWNHSFSCPKIRSYQFEGEIWPEDQVIMLVIEDCYLDGNPQHGLGCRHQENDCYIISYLLERR